MRILILGSGYAAEKFFELFKKNQENIVFSSMNHLENFMDFANFDDIKDFCLANDINLVLNLDEEFICKGYTEQLCDFGIYAFSPSFEAISIVVSKAEAKKFMHKNKILTPRFSITEKPQLALEYINNIELPQAIRPDNHSWKECTQFAETYVQAQEIINKFFASGNKKVIIEDYIEGKNISVWAISDGYSAKIIGTCAKYQDEISLFNPNFITEELKEKIFQNAILPTISSLCAQDEEYVGILGFDFILKGEKFFLLGYNSFFDDLSVNFFAEGFEIDWAKVFESCIRGDVLMEYNFEPVNEYMLSIRQDDEIKFLCAKTKTNLERYLKELDFDFELYEQAEKIWNA